MPTLESLVQTLELGTYEGDSQLQDLQLWPKGRLGWNVTDLKDFGRCYTMIPPETYQKLGISHFALRVKKLVRVFFHSPGSFTSMNEQARKYIDVRENEKVFADMEHQIYQFLDHKGGRCNSADNYSMDECITKALNAVSFSNCLLLFHFNHSLSTVDFFPSICFIPKHLELNASLEKLTNF